MAREPSTFSQPQVFRAIAAVAILGFVLASSGVAIGAAGVNAPAPHTCTDEACPAASPAEVATGAAWLLDTTGFPRRWNCGTWSEWLGWLHIISDAAIWGAYMAIPLVLGFFIIKRRTPLPLVTVLFIAFIASCGIGHLIESIIFWQPVYRLAGVWKAVTAVVSWATVIALIPIVPKVLRWPTLKEVNAELQSEVKIREQAESRIRQIVESAPVGMVMIDRAGTIAMANAELTRVFGYEGDDLIGKPIETLVPERFRDAHAANRGAFYAAPERRRMGAGRQLHGVRKDKSEVPVDIGLHPIRMTGDQDCVLATVVDVTEQRRIEDELRSLNSSMEAKNAELEQFVYAASHDLRSPMVTMQGYATLLQEDIDSGRTDRLVRHADRIAEATVQMRSTIDDLLDFSRVGHLDHEPVEIDSRAMLDLVISNLESAISEADVTIHFEDDLPTVLMDRTGFIQVFQNLIGNAIKHGSPSDAPHEVRVGGRHVADGVEFTVSDNGPGILPEHRERVFGLFQQLKPEEGGTGVGLAIVKRIVEAHGGRISVDSSPAGGARFEIALPAQTPAAVMGSEGA